MFLFPRLSLVLAASLLTSTFAKDPVGCDGFAYSVATISISSTTNSSVNLELLDAGPSHNAVGQLLLQTSTGPFDPSNQPVWFYETCNSSFMGYVNTLDRGPNDTVTFYGHITRTTGLSENTTYWCLERSPDGNIVEGLCSFDDGPSQLRQYWKMVKVADSPLDPSPITFLGARNGTKFPVSFAPEYHSFNETNVVSEVPINGSVAPQFELYFTYNE